MSFEEKRRYLDEIAMHGESQSSIPKEAKEARLKREAEEEEAIADSRERIFDLLGVPEDERRAIVAWGVSLRKGSFADDWEEMQRVARAHNYDPNNLGALSSAFFSRDRAKMNLLREVHKEWLARQGSGTQTGKMESHAMNGAAQKINGNGK